jgi:CRP-like cAMP-binding protein
MLALADIPLFIKELYHRQKTAVESMMADIDDKIKKTVTIAPEINAVKQIGDYYFCFIKEGFFKLHIQNKLVRFYSDSDILILDHIRYDDYEYLAEFPAVLIAVPTDAFLQKLQENSNLLNQWLAILHTEASLNIFLSSCYKSQDTALDFTIRHYQNNEIIITENETAESFFEMIDGQAAALKNGIQIGKINAGEFFGEISFLTDNPRSATIRAVGDCMVRVIDKIYFSELIKNNPGFMINIAQTLAKRLLACNQEKK